MSYSSYSDRKNLEEDGSLGLYSDSSGRMYTEVKGEKIYFTWGEWATPASGNYFNKDWYGNPTWDFYAAEKRGNDILLITRSGFDHLDSYNSFQEKIAHSRSSLFMKMASSTCLPVLNTVSTIH